MQPLVPLAFNALNDLVQTMRSSMSLPQVARVVYLFSRNVHDPTLSLNVQSSSVRLLLNLVDGIYHHPDSSGRAETGTRLVNPSHPFENGKEKETNVIIV